MKKRKLIIIGLASTLTIGGISLLAHARDQGRSGSYCDHKEGKGWHHPDSWGGNGPRHNKPHHGPWGEAGSGILFHLEKQISRLELSKAQREPIYAVLDDNRPVLRNLGSEIADTHQALRQLGLNTENYQQRLSELATAELNQKLILKIGEVKSKVFALLNEQQQADFLKSQEKRRPVW